MILSWMVIAACGWLAALAAEMAEPANDPLIGQYPDLIKAERLIHTDQLEAAHQALTAFLGVHTDVPPEIQLYVKTKIAKILATWDRIDEALAQFEDILKLPGIPVEERIDTLYNVAKYTQYRGDPLKAKELYGSLLASYQASHPYQWGVYWSRLRLAVIAWRTGDPGLALTTHMAIANDAGLRTVLERSPAELGAVYLFIGDDLRLLGRYDEAAAVLRRLIGYGAAWNIRESDKIMLGELNLARCLWLGGKPKEALEVWQKLLDPGRYLTYAPFVNYPGLLARISEVERRHMGLSIMFEDFLTAIATYEAGMPRGQRRDLAILYPDPTKGLDQLKP